MTFGEMLGAIRRFWIMVVVFTLVAVAVAAAAATLPEKRYEARATLLAQPDADVVDFASVEAVRFLLPSFAELVSTNTFRGEVGQRLQPPLAASEVDATAQFEPGTGILHITGTDTDAARAQRIAQVAGVLLGQQQLSESVQITVLDAPTVPTAPAGPGTPTYLAGGLILGILGGILSAIVLSAAARARRQSIEAGGTRLATKRIATKPELQDGESTRAASEADGDGDSAVPGAELVEGWVSPDDTPRDSQGSPGDASEPAVVTSESEPAFVAEDAPRTRFEPVAGVSATAAATEEPVVEPAEKDNVDAPKAAQSTTPGELAATIEELRLSVLQEIPIKSAANGAAANGAGDFDQAFRRLGTTLLEQAGEHSRILITSPRAGAGRTTVTANTAWSLAIQGCSVLAVDGDTTSPMLHRFLRVPNDRGLSELAAAGLSEVVQMSALPTLSVVAAGMDNTAGATVLEEAMPRLFAEADDELVLIDGPAMLDSPTGAAATRTSRAVVLVVDASDTRSSADITTCLSDLTNLGVEVLGVVVNKISAVS